MNDSSDFFLIAFFTTLAGITFGIFSVYVDDHNRWKDYCRGWVKINGFWHHF
jgi:hypothetical protein